jgi:2-phospho-L-lactate guanylyltransferase
VLADDIRTDYWDVFLPLKQFAIGKSRFRGLANTERISLIKAMASDVIESLLQLAIIDSITIVGENHLDATANRDPRIRSLPMSVLAGINADLHQTIGASERIAVILPDLPTITSGELAIALDLADVHEQSFIPDFAGRGTTSYFSTRSKVFNPQFGPNSALAHLRGGAIKLSHPSFVGIMRDCDDFKELEQFPLSALGRSTRSIMEPQFRK